MNQPRPPGNYGYERGLWRASVRVMSTTVVQALPITREPVLVMTCDPAEAAWLRETLEPRFTLGVCGSASAGLAALRQRPRQPIVLGSRLADTTPVGFLADARAQVMAALGEDALVLTVGDQGPAGATLEADAVFYAITRGLHGHDVRALVDCAVAELRARACPPPHAMRGASEAAQLQQVLGLARRLALQDDATQAASVAEEAVLELTDALRARCLFYDAESSELWRAAGDGQEGGRATAGLAGFAARTVRTVVVPRADQDPRYAPAIDDPQGAGDERLLVVPVTDPRGQVHAVLVAVRRERQPEFDAADVELLQALVEQWGPLLGQLTLRQQAEAVLAEARAEHEQRVVFRADAMRLHDEGQRTGEVLRGSPGWASVSYWLVLAFVVVGIAYLALGRVHQHSVGPAVIHTEGQHELTAVVAGKVVGLEVEPGQAVAAGQVLARLYDAAEEAELEQLDVEWRARLRQFLASPGDHAGREQLAALRARRDRARARLEERTIRAPEDGRIGDVRVREGQHLAAGDTVATLLRAGSAPYLVALLPGSDRPQLRPGMLLRFEVTGYRYAYQQLEIEAVAEQVIGPAEARRYLGPQSADSVPLDSSVVLVRARLPAESFRVGDDVLRYHDGMSGRAEARLRSEPILVTLLPWLERIGE